jgi:hypothetical protein
MDHEGTMLNGTMDKEEIITKLDSFKQKPKQWVQAYYNRMEKLFIRGKLEDVGQRKRFLFQFYLEIRKLCVMRDYANMEKMFIATLEVEWVLIKLVKILLIH